MNHKPSVSPFTFACLLASVLASAASATGAPDSRLLWQIGLADGGNAEFALAPGDYAKFQDDGFFVVGQSDSRRDWPYAQPGPADAWAGSRPHTFTVVFGIQTAPKAGACRLQLALLDVHATARPMLRIAVNGAAFDRMLGRGAGDASIHGQPRTGRPQQVDVPFPASLLKPGNNLVEITTLSGSWVLYDSLSLSVPDAVQAAPVTPFTQLTSVSLLPGEARKGTAAVRRLSAAVAHAGPPVTGEISLDGKVIRTSRFAAGRQREEFDVPAVKESRTAKVALTVDGKRVGQQEVRVTPGVREIVVVFKTHFDIGYTDMASNVVQTYRTRFMDNALKVADESRTLPADQQFVWTIPGWPMHKILQDWPGRDAERQHRVRLALKEGRFVLHALPFTTHTELLEPEDLVRGLGYSTRLARELGLNLPRDAKMTDVPEHAAMMATLLNHAGVTFMHIGCNGMSGSPQVPPIYWWQGPDGSRVLTMYSPNYGTGLLPPGDWPYRTWLALLHTGDNHGPPRPEEVKNALDEVAKRMPGVKVRIGRLSDFGDALLAEKPDLPVVRADMPDTWIHGPMSDPAGARLARNTRPMLSATEALNTELRCWSVPVRDAEPVVAAAYEQSLLYGEHTWGGAIGWANPPCPFGEEFLKARAAGRFDRIEGSWDEHTAYIRKAHDLIEPALAENLVALAEAVNADGWRAVVFNPLPWKRSGLVAVDRAPAGVAALRSDAGEVAAVASDGARTVFFAADIPAMGYRTFVPVKAELADSTLRSMPGNATLESPFFKAELDAAHGSVRSLIDKRTGRELVDKAAAPGFGAYLYERFDSRQVKGYLDAYLKGSAWTTDFDKPGLPPADQVPYKAASPQDFSVRFEQTPLSVAAVMDAPAGQGVPHAVTTRLVLYKDQPFVDLEITVHDKPFDSWPEAGWLCLPFNLKDPQFRVGRLANIIDPSKDIIAGANRHILGLNTGVAMFDSRGAGVGFCPLDNPLVSLDTPGCWKFSKDFFPRKPIGWVNLFNNQWNTNFRLWNKGTWTARVRLWAFDKYTANASLIAPCLEARQSLLAAAASGTAGPLPPSRRGLELSRTGVAVTAFGPNPDGHGALLRLWELAGKSGRLTVTLPPRITTDAVQPVDLRGRPVGQPIPVRSGKFKISLPAFAPASFTWL